MAHPKWPLPFSSRGRLEHRPRLLKFPVQRQPFRHHKSNFPEKAGHFPEMARRFPEMANDGMKQRW